MFPVGSKRKSHRIIITPVPIISMSNILSWLHAPTSPQPSSPGYQSRQQRRWRPRRALLPAVPENRLSVVRVSVVVTPRSSSTNYPHTRRGLVQAQAKYKLNHLFSRWFRPLWISYQNIIIYPRHIVRRIHHGISSPRFPAARKKLPAHGVESRKSRGSRSAPQPGSAA